MTAIPLLKETNEDAAGEQPAIRCADLSLTYSDECAALRGVWLELPRRRHYVIMGPSGSGKSTLLGCLSGRLKPCGGEFERRGRVATIHQDLRLVAERSALENVLHGSFGRRSLLQTLFTFPKSERDRSIQLLCRVGLCEKIYVPVKRLSGGERQRVAIARALMQDPTILLADEPVASLDEENAHEIMGLISSLAEERRLTVVSVLHDFQLAHQYGDRIIRLVNGRVVYERDASVREFAQRSTLPIVEQPNPRHAHSQTAAALPEQVPSKPFDWKLVPILAAGLIVYLWSVSGLDLHGRDLSEMASGIASFLKQLIPGSYEELIRIPWATLGAALVETLQMAVVGTSLGLVFAWPLAAIAAGNVGPRHIRRLVRFLLNTVRTVPSLIWALVFVAAVGLGTYAGILALTAYSIGYLSKFFYEAFEAVDPGPPEALREIGASGLQRFLHAVWPAATPAVLSSAMFMLEYNVRAASVLGVVDAGGIGFYMKQYIDFRAFPSLLACLLMILIVVVGFDAISSRVRTRLLKTD